MKWFEISSAIILIVSGKDSVRYLNARFTNDIRSLQLGEGCLAGALNPQGKVEGIFSVHKLEDARFLLLCDGGEREQVVSAFRRYIVADRVEVIDESDKRQLFHLIDASSALIELGFSSGSSPFTIEANNGSFAIQRARGPISGTDLLVPCIESEQIRSLLNRIAPPLSTDEQTLLRIQGEVPSYGHEISTNLIFSEVGLKDAISYTKGCYTGQEVMEKIDARGKAPRILKRLKTRTPSQITKGDVIALTNESSQHVPVGEVLSAAFDAQSNETLAFGILRNKGRGPGEKLLVRGVEVEEF